MIPTPESLKACRDAFEKEFSNLDLTSVGGNGYTSKVPLQPLLTPYLPAKPDAGLIEALEADKHQSTVPFSECRKSYERAIAIARQHTCAGAGKGVVDAWQPVETAPKDGTHILFGRGKDWGASGNCLIGFWYEACNIPHWMAYGGGEIIPSIYSIWQPLPAQGKVSDE